MEYFSAPWRVIAMIMFPFKFTKLLVVFIVAENDLDVSELLL